MKKVKDIIGLRVLAYDTGEKLDDVEDVLFDPEEDRVLALLIDRGGWFSSAKIIPFESIQSIGEDAVIIPARNSIMLAADDRRVKQALDSKKVVNGMDVYTSEGTYLGTIADMVIDEATGVVEGYDVSGGLVKRTMKGLNFVPTPEKERMGVDVVFVPPATGQRVQEEVTGGLQGAAQQASEQTKAGVEQAAENIQQAAGSAKEKAAHFTADQQKRYVVGKRASDTVSTPAGIVIARRDETITPYMADEAERYGVLGQLTAAAGGAQAREATGGVREEARGAFDEMKRTFQDLTGRAQEKTKEERIKASLGRPVTRVILDRNDEVILNTGEIITHEAIQRAEAAGELDVLLSSASKEEPDFSTEERRAPMSGEARLKKNGENIPGR